MISSVLIKFVIKLIFSAFCGLALKIVMVKTNHRWLSTYGHTISFVLLPVITCGITSVIKTNIALSLGLVGALSIVRFRNPVKNSLELIMYFALISLGIIASVNIFYCLYTTVIFILIIIFIYYYDKLQLEKGNKIHNLSFEEGNYLYSLEVESKEKVDQLENNKLLIHKIYSKENGKYFYRLCSSIRSEIDEVYSSIENNENLTKIDVSY